MVNTELFDLTGKVALTTGSSKGIGKAMACALAEHGARVMISSRKLGQCEAAAAEINEVCGEDRAVAFACNAGHKEQLQALVDATHEKLGPVDILLSNAAVNPFYGSMFDIPDTAFDKIMATNVKSNHWLCGMVAPDMLKKGHGSIMITSSIGAFQPSDVIGTYQVSKTALLGLVRNLALELGPDGVRVNCICPGLIRTDFAKALWEDPESEKRVAGEFPLRRLGVPGDLKGVAVFLASDASSYITAQALTVCGGRAMCR